MYKADEYLDSEFTPQDVRKEQTFGTLPGHLSDNQIVDVLSKVNLENSMLKLSNNDESLIVMMKDIIFYQRSKSQQREKLLNAIVSNVKYLSSLHQKNTADLHITKERLAAIDKMNGLLQEENHNLKKKVDVFEELAAAHARKQAELSNMIIES